jgi:hypothetical protein
MNSHIDLVPTIRCQPAGNTLGSSQMTYRVVVICSILSERKYRQITFNSHMWDMGVLTKSSCFSRLSAMAGSRDYPRLWLRSLAEQQRPQRRQWKGKIDEPLSSGLSDQLTAEA